MTASDTLTQAQRDISTEATRAASRRYHGGR